MQNFKTQKSSASLLFPCFLKWQEKYQPQTQLEVWMTGFSMKKKKKSLFEFRDSNKKNSYTSCKSQNQHYQHSNQH